MSGHQNAGQNHNLMIAIKFLNSAAEFKYLGMTVTDQNCTPEEIKNRLNLRNACCHSVQYLLSSCLLSETLKMEIYKTIILPVFLLG
jgi:hypothetical protein